MVSFPIPCVIFAGGKSSRMGKDKALLPFRGFSTLAEFQYRRLKPYFSSTYISTKKKKFPFEAPLIIDDPKQDIYAPTVALVRVFEELDDEAVFILSVDTPFVEIKEIQILVKTGLEMKYDAVVAKSPAGIHPMCGVYCRSILPTLQKAVDEGNHRLTDILEASNTLYIRFDSDDPFFNINRPEEYASALKNLS